MHRAGARSPPLRFAFLPFSFLFFASTSFTSKILSFSSNATYIYIYILIRACTRDSTKYVGERISRQGRFLKKFVFFQNRAGRVGNRTGLYRRKLDSGRFPPLEISNSVTRRVSTLDIENRLWPIPKTMHDSEPVILRTRKRSWPRNVRFPCIGLIEYSHDIELTRSQTN